MERSAIPAITSSKTVGMANLDGLCCQSKKKAEPRVKVAATAVTGSTVAAGEIGQRDNCLRGKLGIQAFVMAKSRGELLVFSCSRVPEVMTTFWVATAIASNGR